MRISLITESVRHLASSFDKQLHLPDVVESHNWRFDLAAGELSFGSLHRWHAQPLGTESEHDNSWLWAWANIDSNIPGHLLNASHLIKAYGEQYSIPELIQPEVPCDHINGHMLALLASGVCEANAYHRCPFDGGALYVLIIDEKYPKCPDPPIRRVSTVFPQAIALINIPNHKFALAGYLSYYNLAFQDIGNQIIVNDSGEPILTATFDEQNRLTHLASNLNTPAVNTSRMWDEMLLRRMLGW